MFLNHKSVLTAGLRGVTLFSKLAITILLARALSVADFAEWVLIVAVVNYGIFLVGAEIYNLTLRSYIAEGHAAVVAKFSAQWTYFAGVYSVVLVVGLVLSLNAQGAFQQNALLIALILVLEHLTQELHRAAVFRDEQVHANAILLLKSAGWMVPLAGYLFIAQPTVELANVLVAWCAGSAVASLYALTVYRDMIKGLRRRYLARLRGRIGEVMRSLSPFLILVIAIRTPYVLDRYLIERFVGAAQLGAYGYYATFGNGVQSIFEAVVLARLIPQLLGGGDQAPTRMHLIGTFMRMSAGYWAICIATLCVVVPYLSQFVGKKGFEAEFPLMLVLLAGQMIFSLSVVVQYGLYALRRDRDLTTGALVYLILCLLGYALLIPLFGSYGAATAQAVAAAGLLAFRLRQLRVRAAPELA